MSLLPLAAEMYDQSNEQQMRRLLEDRIYNVESALYSLQTTVGTLRLNDGDITVVNGNNNDLAIGYSTHARINGPTAAFTLTGFAGGELGRFLIVRNTTAQQMTIANESASSLAVNRINTMAGADVVLPATNGATAVFEYDATLLRWILLATRPSDTGTAGPLLKANNLSDLANAGTARTNLGLGSVATHPITDLLQVANNLSDLNNAATARSNLGLGSIATLAAGATAITSGNLNSGTSLVINNIPTNYAALMLSWFNLTCDTASRSLLIQLSADNGSTFDTTAGNYVGMYSNASAVAITNQASITMSGAVAAAAVRNGHIMLFNMPNIIGGFGNNFCLGYSDDGSTPFTTYVCDKGMNANALRFLWNGSGNFNGSGTYALYGYR